MKLDFYDHVHTHEVGLSIKALAIVSCSIFVAIFVCRK